MTRVLNPFIIAVLSISFLFYTSCKKGEENAVQNQAAVETIPGLVVENTEIFENNKIDSKSLLKIEKGAIVKIYPIPNEKEYKRSAGFYNIEHNNIKGWIHEDYLSENFIHSKDGQKSAWMSNGGKFYCYDNKTKQADEIYVEDDMFNFVMSESFKYVAFDIGTDVTGTVEIYNPSTGKKIYSAPYTRHDLKWDGEKISIEKIITPCKKQRAKWIEEIFNDGAISKGKGKGDVECSE